MMLFHGTDNVDNYNSIKKNGFKINDGNYGAGVYLTTDFELAKTYADNNGNNVIRAFINDIFVKEMTYSELSLACNVEPTGDGCFETSLEIPEAKEYAEKNNIKAILIQYKNTDEIVVYDSSKLIIV